MSKPLNFARCSTCGAHGHYASQCPARQVYESQQKQELVKQHNIRLGLTPALEAEIADIRRNWGLRNAAIACANGVRFE